MRWIPDPTGRFIQRPYYETDELDHECEALVTQFLQEQHGSIRYPITTGDLTILIEKYADSLDQYADLTKEGPNIEGLTEFIPGRNPVVQITSHLSEDPWREHRLRTTLSHELGHVRFHAALYGVEQPSLLEPAATRKLQSPRCKREVILGARASDWLEWQAGYASGSFLMPLTALHDVVLELLRDLSASCPVSVGTYAGDELVSRVQQAFLVSSQAATVRLIQRQYLTEAGPSQPLFQ